MPAQKFGTQVSERESQLGVESFMNIRLSEHGIRIRMSWDDTQHLLASGELSAKFPIPGNEQLEWRLHCEKRTSMDFIRDSNCYLFRIPQSTLERWGKGLSAAGGRKEDYRLEFLVDEVPVVLELDKFDGARKLHQK